MRQTLAPAVELWIDGADLYSGLGMIQHGRIMPEDVEYIRDEHGHGRVTVKQISPLILATDSWVAALLDGKLTEDPILSGLGVRCSAFYDDGRLFLRTSADNGVWTWELSPTYWRDVTVQAPSLFIGRWPD